MAKFVDEFYDDFFFDDFFDEFWFFGKFFVTYNLLTIASFRIGVPSILFLFNFGVVPACRLRYCGA